MPPKPEQTEQQPGADRFWGQFSQSKAGRSSSGERSRKPESDADQDGWHEGHCLEWCPICRSAELFKTAVSPELRQQAEAIQHEAIGVLKAFLDAYAEKAAEQPGGADDVPPAQKDEPEQPGPQVTDIPLD